MLLWESGVVDIVDVFDAVDDDDQKLKKSI